MFGSRHILDINRALAAIVGRLEQLETEPVPEGWRDPVSALQLDLKRLTEAEDRLGQALEQLVAEVGSLGSLQAAVDRLEARDKQITLAVAEGIEKVERAERRVGATIARAQKKLKDLGYTDPGLEAEADQLRLVDGAGGDDDRVPELPAEVAEIAQAASSVPGVTAAQLAKVRGI